MTMMILIVFLIILTVSVIALMSGKKSSSNKTADDPLEILKQRLAKGEISSYEYEELKRTLKP